MKFSQKMPLYFFSTMVQKSQKWPKTQIKGGSCLRVLLLSRVDAMKQSVAVIFRVLTDLISMSTTLYTYLKHVISCIDWLDLYVNNAIHISNTSFWRKKPAAAHLYEWSLPGARKTVTARVDQGSAVAKIGLAPSLGVTVAIVIKWRPYVQKWCSPCSGWLTSFGFDALKTMESVLCLFVVAFKPTEEPSELLNRSGKSPFLARKTLLVLIPHGRF